MNMISNKKFYMNLSRYKSTVRQDTVRMMLELFCECGEYSLRQLLDNSVDKQTIAWFTYRLEGWEDRVFTLFRGIETPCNITPDVYEALEGQKMTFYQICLTEVLLSLVTLIKVRKLAGLINVIKKCEKRKEL